MFGVVAPKIGLPPAPRSKIFPYPSPYPLQKVSLSSMCLVCVRLIHSHSTSEDYYHYLMPLMVVRSHVNSLELQLIFESFPPWKQQISWENDVLKISGCGTVGRGVSSCNAMTLILKLFVYFFNLPYRTNWHSGQEALRMCFRQYFYGLLSIVGCYFNVKNC